MGHAVTTIMDHRLQTTMSGDEVRLRSAFVSSTTYLSSEDVYLPAPRMRRGQMSPSATHPLRASLVPPMVQLSKVMPNWDGHGGKAPPAAALVSAVELLSALPKEVPDPEIMASTEGGVLIEWDTGRIELLLNVTSAGIESAVVSIDGEEVEGPLGFIRDQVVQAFSLLMHRA